MWLALATFSMGIDGYVLAGLLPQIAGDLFVTEAAAGRIRVLLVEPRRIYATTVARHLVVLT